MPSLAVPLTPSAPLLAKGGDVARAMVGVAPSMFSPASVLRKRADFSSSIDDETLSLRQTSKQYALGWIYLSLLLLLLATALRSYHFLHDKVRKAVHQDNSRQRHDSIPRPAHELTALPTDKSTRKLFPRELEQTDTYKKESRLSTSRPINIVIAIVRGISYLPLRSPRLKGVGVPFRFPSLGAASIVLAALTYALCSSLIPQPFYRQGLPLVAIRAGMIAVAMLPWIVALGVKANFIAMLTGIGHERLNVLHRWAAYIFLILSLIHTIPFYVAPVWRNGGSPLYDTIFEGQNTYIYGSGVAALVPLLLLCLHSLRPLRHRFHEIFVKLHAPLAVVLLALLFWHCDNYLKSWDYLWATMAIWLASYIVRLFYLNWSSIRRESFLVGEEAAITVLPEDGLKVTIPTEMRWKPGQYVYLRMPGISLFENHPFTIASMCSDDFPSEYGKDHRDMLLVFRPYGGFTRKVLDKALDNGPWRTYRAFLDGPYGGMRRKMESFDHVVMIAGGSGITAIVSQLLDLIKRMRDGRAVTKTVHLVWAMKRPETMEWFKEELRICRDHAPPDSVHCSFYITSAKRHTASGQPGRVQTPTRPVSIMLHDKVNDVFQNIADNRFSASSARRISALIRDEAAGDPEKEKYLRAEDCDRIRPLPQAHLKPAGGDARAQALAALNAGTSNDSVKLAPSSTPRSLHEKRRSKALTLAIPGTQPDVPSTLQPEKQQHDFDFGFPATPTEFQKNLMRFAFLPAATVKSTKSGWSTEWGRPDVPFMLREIGESWDGKRACVFVCGPPAMREDVSRTVTGMQKKVLSGEMHEVFLHAENYAI